MSAAVESATNRRVEPECHQPLKVNVTSLVCFSPMVTICVCVPSFSCHASIVYVPGGSPLSQTAVRAGDRIKRMVEHADIGVHPAVNVALEGHHHFPGAEHVSAFRSRQSSSERRACAKKRSRSGSWTKNCAPPPAFSAGFCRSRRKASKGGRSSDRTSSCRTVSGDYYDFRCPSRRARSIS